MAITNYSELKTSMASWLHRSDLTTLIPDFISLAEAEINDDVKIRDMQKRKSIAELDTSTRYIGMPARFNGVFELMLTYTNAEWYPEYVAPNTMKEYRILTSGAPKFFTIWGNEIELNRVPAAAYGAEISFFEKVQALSGSNADNAVITNYPNIYLYGSLAQAEPWLKNDERIAMWRTLYESFVRKANDTLRLSSYMGPIQARAGRATP